MARDPYGYGPRRHSVFSSVLLFPLRVLLALRDWLWEPQPGSEGEPPAPEAPEPVGKGEPAFPAAARPVEESLPSAAQQVSQAARPWDPVPETPGLRRAKPAPVRVARRTPGWLWGLAGLALVLAAFAAGNLTARGKTAAPAAAPKKSQQAWGYRCRVDGHLVRTRDASSCGRVQHAFSQLTATEQHWHAAYQQAASRATAAEAAAAKAEAAAQAATTTTTTTPINSSGQPAGSAPAPSNEYPYQPTLSNGGSVP